MPLYNNSTGGASTFTALTDASTVDLAAENAPLQEDLDAKADYLAEVAISSNTSLTAAAHANRTLKISGSGIVLTIDNDAATGCTGDEFFYAVPVGAATFTIVAGTATFTATSGTSLDSSTAVGGVCSVQRVAANTFKASSPIIVSAAAGAVYVHTSSAGTSDIGTGATTETVAFDWTLPALGARDEVQLRYSFFGSGTGNKVWRLRIGGTGLDGTILWTITNSGAFGTHGGGFSNNNATNSQIGASSGTGGHTTAQGASATGTDTVDTSSAGVHLYLTVQKSTGADVVSTAALRGVIYPGV